MDREIIKFENCSINSYSDDSLQEFYFHMNEGTINALIGVSGSGKSALCDYLIGNVPLEKGRVIFMGKECMAGERFPYATNVIYIGKNSSLIPSLSVAENIYVINQKRRGFNLVNKKNINYRTRLLLSQYAMDISPTIKAGSLTYGQAVIVELLRAIENEAKLVLIDDILQRFGQSDLAAIIELIKIIRERGTGIIYSCHDASVLISNTDKMFVLDKGRLVRTYNEKNYYSHQLQEILNGGQVRDHLRTSHMTDRVKLVMDMNLSQGRHFSLEANEGEIVGLYDMNNVENNKVADNFIKSENVSNLSILISGQTYVPRGMFHAIKQRVGYLSRESFINPLVGSMDFMENLSLSMIVRNKRIWFYNVNKFMELIFEEYHEKIGIGFADRHMKMRMADTDLTTKVLFQKWLLFRPEIMIFSEPFVELDYHMKKEIYEFMEELAEAGTTVIVTSQSMKELRNICDSIYVINEEDYIIKKYDN